MSVKFVLKLKKSEFDPRVRGSVFFQISLQLKKSLNHLVGGWGEKKNVCLLKPHGGGS